MADEKQLQFLKEGTSVWNEWRENHPDTRIDLREVFRNKASLSGGLSRLDLSGCNLSGAHLENANFAGANLSHANLAGANLVGSDLMAANLTGANFTGADLQRANLWLADLSGANLSRVRLGLAFLFKAILSGVDFSGADLSGANFVRADLSHANFTEANLQYASFVESNIEHAILSNCRIYGSSVWNLKGTPQKPVSLIITSNNEPQIIVDDLEVAQFVYLLLNNRKIRNIIDTLTSKVVLILGNFKEERKAVLEAIREKLHELNFTPILFDFDRPISKDVTGTVETLARMARFIIADLTDPSSIPHELATIIPSLRTTPILPIKLEGTTGYSMFNDYQMDLPHRVLSTHEYKDRKSLVSDLAEIIAPANEAAELLRQRIQDSLMK